MGTDRKEIVLKHISRWRDLVLEQEKSLSEGRFDHLERLVTETSTIQKRLDALLSSPQPARLDRETLRLLKEVRDRQAVLIAELEKGSQEILSTLGSLRKNRASLKGYLQGGSHPPRFMNRHT